MNLSDLVQILTSSGPWGLVALFGWAFWKVQGRKDAEVRVLNGRIGELYEKIGDLCKEQIEATLRMEQALIDLTKELQAKIPKLKAIDK